MKYSEDLKDILSAKCCNSHLLTDSAGAHSNLCTGGREAGVPLFLVLYHVSVELLDALFNSDEIKLTLSKHTFEVFILYFCLHLMLLP